jgi:putative ABC transport system permease protein
MRIELPRSKYAESQRSTQFTGQVLERVAALPGVKSAGVINHTPMSGFGMIAFFSVEGSPPPRRGQDTPVPVGVVSPDYFHAMGIPLVNGRFFNDGDNQASSIVVIINESMARRFFSNEDPIGKGIGFGCKDGLCRKIVGVVGDVMQEGPTGELTAEVYLPYSQFGMTSMTLVVHTGSDPLSLVGAIRSQVTAVDKDQPIAAVKTLEQHLTDAVGQSRLMMSLLGSFGGIALILAAVGVYGMMSYAVAGRTREIGIRMALGAQRRDVVRMVVGQATLLTLIGTAVGLAAAVALTRVMSTLLFHISPTDPITFVAMPVLLAGAALGASFVPARRATKVDPIVALRCE